ncbi:hypothetical protein [Chryseobacterium takakiae]|jgi:hypothetical protein|uniref:Uncharacterized protein n=1 Tax=Chryseobacterium takakiae TaxID=1302685 RepID=A0A1M4ZUV9_9FLAO|nr:hypothetical protein [Chryseobacterium takakiae]SHF21761.1 hypothetical protein SAMN05444408_11123 [Chryseobacterium takakiae]
MNQILTILAVLFTFPVTAQNPEKFSKEINEEGIALYHSEMTSWNGTDIFIENYKNRENIGGYFSYLDEGIPKCIFFSKSQKVIGTISFPANYNPKDAQIDLSERDFTPHETEYFTIRQNALKRMQNDSIFKIYKDTNLNIVPLIRNKVKKVYVLTATSAGNAVIFGNDYLITFDNENQVKNVEKLHNSMIVQKINDEKIGHTISGMHSHVIDKWQAITPTDICTLMLYQKFTGWESYTTISKKFVSIWNSDNNLVIMKTEDFKGMTEKMLKNKKGKSKTEKEEE